MNFEILALSDIPGPSHWNPNFASPPMTQAQTDRTGTRSHFRPIAPRPGRICFKIRESFQISSSYDSPSPSSLATDRRTETRTHEIAERYGTHGHPIPIPHHPGMA